MNMIDWFEKKIGRNYPKSARVIIDFLIGNKQKRIEFDFQRYGPFEVLDFHNLDPIKNGQTSPLDWEDTYSNPYFLIDKIEEYLTRYFPNNNINNILPFAREVWGDRLRYLVFCNRSVNPVLINIDSMTFQPHISKFDISYYLPIELIISQTNSDSNIIKVNTRKIFFNILDANSYFFDIPDGIWSVNDYSDLLKKSFFLYDSSINIDFISMPNIDDKYVFNIKINEFTKSYYVDKCSHYIDSCNLVAILNDILQNIDKCCDRFFVELRDVCDFGIALIKQEQCELLIENGYTA